MMRLAQYLTFFIVFLSVPVAVVGAYVAYTSAQDRVRELNEITPLNETDLEKAARLALGVDDAEAQADDEASVISNPQDTMPNIIMPTPVPTLGGDAVALADATPADTEPDDTVNNAEATDEPTQSAEVQQVAENTAAEIEINPRRRTVLLMGVDQREGEEGPFRTDTMIVLSVDPVARTGAMLSIPRDVYVTIPGTGTQERINTANFVGDSPDINYPGGGPALAMLTVERLLGVPIDHYVLVNFTAFNTFIDAIGPIEVCPSERIVDEKYPDGSYGTITITIEAGCQEMDGTTLLQYARTRATEGGDFDRANRQQEVILAVRQKVLSLGGASALLGDAFTLWEAVSDNVRTDLTLDEMIELALAASSANDIHTATISAGEVLQGTANDGSQILVPIQTDIFDLVANLFRPPTRAAADDGVNYADLLDREALPLEIRTEAAIVVLLNGTSIQGRAGDLRDYVLSYQMDVGSVGNAATTEQINTTITYYGNHAASADYLAKILATINGNNLPEIIRGEGTAPQEGDVFVVIGSDLAVPQSGGS